LVLSLFLVFNFSVYPTKAVFGTEDIIFEYGAESGEVDPPLDWVQVAGDGYIETTTSSKRTANRSIDFYISPDGSTDASRRARIWKYQNDFDNKYMEFYLSYWIYFPAEDPWTTSDSDGWGTTFGGWSMWFGAEGESSWSRRTGGSFRMRSGTSREIRYRYSWRDYPTDGAGSEGWNGDSGLYTDNELSGCWTQFQHYVKITEGSDSVVKAWINSTLVFEKTTWTDMGYTCADPRGYSAWSDENFRWASSTRDGYPNFKLGMYDDVDSKDKQIQIDDIVWSTEKVPSSYGVGYTSVEFESWEDGFESGNFSEWNGTQQSGGGVAPSVTSTYAYDGTYSANFTTDGAENSYSRAMHIIQNTSEVYQRSFVRFEELPDTNETRIMIMRISQEDGTFIANTGIFRNATGYYWVIRVAGQTQQNFSATVSADVWNGIEMYFNATVDGNATLWVNGTVIGTHTGDFSGVGNLARVYPYIYIGDGAQATAKTVYHDNYRVDNVRIGSGTPIIIIIIEEEEVEDEDEEGNAILTTYTGPLANITINGTYLSDSGGYHEFTNLTYNQIYLFIVELPVDYYPRWVVNFDGSFEWNGTHFLVYHNITEAYEGYLQFSYTPIANDPYISEASGTITTVSTSYSSSSRNMYLTMTSASTALIETRERFTPSYYDVVGADQWFWIGLDYTFEVEGTSAVTVEWR